jgi:hypothetical protein
LIRGGNRFSDQDVRKINESGAHPDRPDRDALWPYTIAAGPPQGSVFVIE